MIHPSPTHWMEQALLQAELAQKKGEVPIGALLVREDKIIGQGFNQRIQSGRTTSHAEIVALENYNEEEKEWRVYPGTSLYVTVEPCLMCTGALLWARVDRIYYGCEDPKNAGLRRMLSMIEEGVFDHRFEEVTGGILEGACQKKLKAYFKTLRAKKR